MNTYKVVKSLVINDKLLSYAGSYKAGDLIVVPDDHAGALLQAGKIAPMTPGAVNQAQSEEEEKVEDKKNDAEEKDENLELFRVVAEDGVTYQDTEYAEGDEFEADPKEKEMKKLIKKHLVEEL